MHDDCHIHAGHCVIENAATNVNRWLELFMRVSGVSPGREFRRICTLLSHHTLYSSRFVTNWPCHGCPTVPQSCRCSMHIADTVLALHWCIESLLCKRESLSDPYCSSLHSKYCSYPTLKNSSKTGNTIRIQWVALQHLA